MMNNTAQNILVLRYSRISDSIICFVDGQDETIKEQKYNPEEDYLKRFSNSKINLCVLSEYGNDSEPFLEKHKDYLDDNVEHYWCEEKISSALTRISEKLRLFRCNFNNCMFGKGINVKKFVLIYPQFSKLEEQYEKKEYDKFATTDAEYFQSNENTTESDFVKFWKNLKL